MLAPTVGLLGKTKNTFSLCKGTWLYVFICIQFWEVYCDHRQSFETHVEMHYNAKGELRYLGAVHLG